MRLSLVTIVFRTESETALIRRWAGFLDEPESSKQSRLRAWNVLQRLRMVLSENVNVAIPPPAHKTFDAEGEALERAFLNRFVRLCRNRLCRTATADASLPASVGLGFSALIGILSRLAYWFGLEP